MATIGVSFGSKARSIPRVPYFFRKPDPQCDTTWASSTTIESMRLRISGSLKTFLTKRLESNISGEITTICHLPVQTSLFCSLDIVECVAVFSYCHYFFRTAPMCAVDCYGSKFEFILEVFCLCGHVIKQTCISLTPDLFFL